MKMKYEYVPFSKNSKTKKMALSFFFGGLILFVIGGIKAIPFRSVIQLASIASLTVSILLVGRFMLRAYAYIVKDFGEGDELVIDEIMRKSRCSVCRLELKKLTAVRRLSELPNDEKKKKRYNYCPDAFASDAYALDFVDGNYDTSTETIRIVLQPDKKLVSIFNEALDMNLQNGYIEEETTDDEDK